MIDLIQNFTTPEIVTSDDLKHRSYISFNFKGTPKREYHGKRISIDLSPNRAKSLPEKALLLKRLQFEFLKALEAGQYPRKIIATETVTAKENLPEPRVKALFNAALNSKLHSQLSFKYKRNLTAIHDQLLAFLTEDEDNAPITDLRVQRLNQFLAQYSSTGTYYMNKRRDLNVLLSEVETNSNLQLSYLKKTTKHKVKAALHIPYDTEQIRPIFDFLEIRYPKLYVVCLLTYGSWLRPHEEIRLLRVRDIQDNHTAILLSGYENKGGKVRRVFIPEYAQQPVKDLTLGLEKEANIFSGKSNEYNKFYFNTAWKRAFVEMFAKGLIRKKQTLYSFRHTAAIQIYRRTKDAYLLQKLLGHTSLTTTLRYLRSLGEFDSEELKAAAPTL